MDKTKKEEKGKSNSRKLVRRSQLFIPTLFQAPADASTLSHQLMLRAGFIRKTALGIYSLLPLALRSLQKLSGLVDEEMSALGAHKLQMPLLLSSELWERSGRWETSGEELIKLKDRREHSFCLAPTHEELFTHLVASEVSSHKQLPLLLYQIGVKYRDEKRPRFGLMRAREFVMKDLYSFHNDKEEAIQTYWKLFHSYNSIFSRLQVPFAAAEADTGNIGGNLSHEFHILSQVGEDALLSCPSCHYLSNIEKARRKISVPTFSGNEKKMEQKIFREKLAKILEQNESLVSMDLVTFISLKKEGGGMSEEKAVVVKKKDRETNSFKLKDFRVDSHQIVLSPLSDFSLLSSLPLFLDFSLLENLEEFRELFAQKINKNQENNEIEIGDFTMAKKGDECVNEKCEGKLEEKRGIEVGQVFYLGKKYSKALEAIVIGKDNKKVEVEMGCYGIGISRILAAVAEVKSDKDGLVWPSCISPYKLLILVSPSPSPSPSSPSHSSPNSNSNSNDLEEKAFEIGEEIVEELPSYGGEVVVDERNDVSFGYKMKEALLIGFPFLIILGNKQKQQQQQSSNSSIPSIPLFEFRERTSQTSQFLTLPQIIEILSKH